jgi:hypothetical protein
MDERGIDRVVIADHNRIEGALRLRDLAPERVLVGEEVKTREGPDIIGIFLNEPIARGTPLRETCEAIRAQGGVVYVRTPSTRAAAGRGSCWTRSRSWWTWWRRTTRAPFARAERKGRVVGARGRKAPRRGSDAHTLAEIGAAFVEVPPFEPTRDGFLRALDAGRVAARGTSSQLVVLGSAYAKVRKLILPD